MLQMHDALELSVRSPEIVEQVAQLGCEAVTLEVPMKVDVSTMMAGNRSLTGVFLGAEIITDRVHNNIQRLIDMAARGDLQVIVDRTFPLSEAAAAHRYIESRQAVGRVVLVP